MEELVLWIELSVCRNVLFCSILVPHIFSIHFVSSGYADCSTWKVRRPNWTATTASFAPCGWVGRDKDTNFCVVGISLIYSEDLCKEECPEKECEWCCWWAPPPVHWMPERVRKIVLALLPSVTTLKRISWVLALLPSAAILFLVLRLLGWGGGGGGSFENVVWIICFFISYNKNVDQRLQELKTLLLCTIACLRNQ